MRWRVAAFLALAGSAAAGAMPRAAAGQTPAAPPSAAAPIDLTRGVAVVALGTSAQDAAWDLAVRVYIDPLLRPQRLDEPTARVVAGEQPDPSGASPTRQELAAIRGTLRNTPDAANMRLLGSLASQLEVSALALVYRLWPDQPHALLYVASTHTFAQPELWKQPDGSGHPSWQAAVWWLHGHAAACHHPAQAPASEHRSVVASPWFWGALGVAAGAAVLVYALTRDESLNTIHVQGRLGP